MKGDIIRYTIIEYNLKAYIYGTSLRLIMRKKRKKDISHFISTTCYTYRFFHFFFCVTSSKLQFNSKAIMLCPYIHTVQNPMNLPPHVCKFLNVLKTSSQFSMSNPANGLILFNFHVVIAQNTY